MRVTICLGFALAEALPVGVSSSEVPPASVSRPVISWEVTVCRLVWAGRGEWVRGAGLVDVVGVGVASVLDRLWLRERERQCFCL